MIYFRKEENMIRVKEPRMENVVECPNCGAKLEYDNEDIMEGYLGVLWIDCPCCKGEVYLGENKLTPKDIHYPQHFYDFKNGVEISGETINKWIQECIESLEKDLNSEYNYIASGNTLVSVIRAHDDESKYVIHVSKNYAEAEV